jgi:hypothetical protein
MEMTEPVAGLRRNQWPDWLGLRSLLERLRPVLDEYQSALESID